METDAEEKKRFDDIVAAMKTRTGKQLKEMLKHNGLPSSGHKEVLAKRVADAKLYGAIPKCPCDPEDEGTCGGVARLKVVYSQAFGHGGQGKFFCPGYFDDDELVSCEYQDDEADRVPWKNLDGEASELLLGGGE